eukprot:g1256.t1
MRDPRTQRFLREQKRIAEIEARDHGGAGNQLRKRKQSPPPMFPPGTTMITSDDPDGGAVFTPPTDESLAAVRRLERDLKARREAALANANLGTVGTGGRSATTWKRKGVLAVVVPPSEELEGRSQAPRARLL